MKSHTLIVFGGSHTDIAIATDFVAISKKFIKDGLNPLCLTGTDLCDVLDICPSLAFGCADTGDRVRIYNMQEARENPFYRMASDKGLKKDIFRWIKNISTRIRPGDRIITVFLGHGSNDASGLKLITRRQPEWLVPGEIMTAVSTLPRNVRLLIVNERCYPGPWSKMGQDFTVETAAQEDKKSYNSHFPTGKRGCLMFATAWIQELETYPEGQIAQRHQRIKEEMQLIHPHQEPNVAVIGANRRHLACNGSHFILSPNIATTIMDVAAKQERPGKTLRACSNARTFWASLRRFPIRDPEAPNVASDGSDLEIVLMHNYIIELGPQAAAMDKNALVTACQIALEGRGQMFNIQKRTVKTILWQELQMERIGTLLQDLLAKNLIGYFFEIDEAESFLRRHREAGYSTPKFTRLSSATEICDLFVPLWDDGFIDGIFNDGVSWLMDTLACNKLLFPSMFDMELIEPVILHFLRKEVRGLIESACGYSHSKT